MNSVTNVLSIEVVGSPEEAPHYKRDRIDVRAASIQKAIIVLNGTVGGLATVDFHIYDQEGNMFVAMLTGAIVKGLAAAITGAEQR